MFRHQKEHKYPQHHKNSEKLIKYETIVEFIWSNRVESVYGESGTTLCMTHTRNRKDIVGALTFNVERDFPLYTDIDMKRLTIKESKYIGG